MNLIMRRKLLDKRCQLEEVAAYAIQKADQKELHAFFVRNHQSLP